MLNYKQFNFHIYLCQSVSFNLPAPFPDVNRDLRGVNPCQKGGKNYVQKKCIIVVGRAFVGRSRE